MKRDMRLIRKILLEVKAKKHVGKAPVVVEGYEENLIDRHVEMLVSAGLLEGHLQRPGGPHQNEMVVTDMSWAGHDFLAALENKDVWSEAETNVLSGAIGEPAVRCHQRRRDGIAFALGEGAGRTKLTPSFFANV